MDPDPITRIAGVGIMLMPPLVILWAAWLQFSSAHKKTTEITSRSKLVIDYENDRLKRNLEKLPRAMGLYATLTTLMAMGFLAARITGTDITPQTSEFFAHTIWAMNGAWVLAASGTIYLFLRAIKELATSNGRPVTY